MAKTVAKFSQGDKVVVRITNWEKDESKLQVALVTNVNPAGKMNKRNYDVRTEAGSGLIQIGVDDKKSNMTIVSSITEAWLANGGTNNMYIHKKHGHTRANFSKDIKLRADGEDMKSDDCVLGHFEKHNDFVFPTQGPRSF